MKTAFLALSAALALSACAEDDYGYGFGDYGYGGYGNRGYGYDRYGYNGYGYNRDGYNGYGSYYGPGTAYYDGYYGRFSRGYRGNDGYYYYRPGYGRPYVRDHGRHDRRDWTQGYRGDRGHGGYRGDRGSGGWSRRGSDHHHDRDRDR
jgi:hypothetical protein